MKLTAHLLNLTEKTYSRKHPLKYFCLNFHTWWEKKKSNFASRVYRSVSALFIFVLAAIKCKVCNQFFTILSWPRWPIDLKLLQVCQLMYMVDYIKCLHYQQLVSSKNQFCNVPLKISILRPGHKLSFFFIRNTNAWVQCSNIWAKCSMFFILCTEC